jgi:hypothetical protein
MPLPLSIDPSSPIDTDSPSEGDNEFRALKDFIASVFGIPLATNVTAAAFAITAGGVVTASQSPFTTKDIVATVGTITTDKPVLKGTETWNAAGVTFNAIDIDVTDTASAAASLLLNIKKATTAQLTLDKNAVLTALGNVQSDANLAFKSGTAFLGTLDHAISAARVWTLPDLTGTVIAALSTTSVTTMPGQYFATAYELTDGATIALDWNDGNVQYVTLGGNRALTFSNPQDGGRYLLLIIQDGTGSRTITSWPTISWRGGSEPTLTTTASKADFIPVVYINGIYYADASKEY